MPENHLHPKVAFLALHGDMEAQLDLLRELVRQTRENGPDWEMLAPRVRGDRAAWEQGLWTLEASIARGEAILARKKAGLN